MLATSSSVGATTQPAAAALITESLDRFLHSVGGYAPYYSVSNDGVQWGHGAAYYAEMLSALLSPECPESHKFELWCRREKVLAELLNSLQSSSPGSPAPREGAHDEGGGDAVTDAVDRDQESAARRILAPMFPLPDPFLVSSRFHDLRRNLERAAVDARENAEKAEKEVNTLRQTIGLPPIATSLEQTPTLPTKRRCSPVPSTSTPTTVSVSCDGSSSFEVVPILCHLKVPKSNRPTAPTGSEYSQLYLGPVIREILRQTSAPPAGGQPLRPSLFPEFEEETSATGNNPNADAFCVDPHCKVLHGTITWAMQWSKFDAKSEAAPILGKLNAMRKLEEKEIVRQKASALLASPDSPLQQYLLLQTISERCGLGQVERDIKEVDRLTGHKSKAVGAEMEDNVWRVALPLICRQVLGPLLHCNNPLVFDTHHSAAEWADRCLQGLAAAASSTPPIHQPVAVETNGVTSDSPPPPPVVVAEGPTPSSAPSGEIAVSVPTDALPLPAGVEESIPSSLQLIRNVAIHLNFWPNGRELPPCRRVVCEIDGVIIQLQPRPSCTGLPTAAVQGYAVQLVIEVKRNPSDLIFAREQRVRLESTLKQELAALAAKREPTLVFTIDGAPTTLFTAASFTEFLSDPVRRFVMVTKLRAVNRSTVPPVNGNVRYRLIEVLATLAATRGVKNCEAVGSPRAAVRSPGVVASPLLLSPGVVGSPGLASPLSPATPSSSVSVREAKAITFPLRQLWFRVLRTKSNVIPPAELYAELSQHSALNTVVAIPSENFPAASAVPDE